jgi:hypothetical protein
MLWAMDVDAAIADLYGLPLEEFTPARNELAKRLRREGDREAAERVAGAKKATAASWAANQLARRRSRETRALIDAGERLRKAQASLGGRDGPRKLREAADAEREAVDRLVSMAPDLASEWGTQLSPAALERLRETLHAAAGDEETRELLKAGRLTEDRRAVGLGSALSGTPARTKRAAEPPAKRADTERRERIAALRKRLDGARRAQREAAGEVRAREREESSARRALEAAERAAERARSGLAEAERKTEALEDELRDTRRAG